MGYPVAKEEDHKLQQLISSNQDLLNKNALLRGQ